MTKIEQLEKKQRKIYHTLAAKLGMSNEQKHYLLMDNFGVNSSSLLDAHQLTNLIYTLESILNKDEDKWRKRVLASIGGYLTAMGKDSNITIIKAIACRSTGYERFNAIPIDRLKSIYNAFKNRTNDISAVDKAVFATMLEMKPTDKYLN